MSQFIEGEFKVIVIEEKSKPNNENIAKTLTQNNH